MDAFIFAAEAVLPIILMIMAGYIFRRIGLMPEQFSSAANKLVFRVLLPCMLFLGVYRIESIYGIELGFVIYTLVAESVVMLVSFFAVRCFCRVRVRRGVLMQAAFRSNYALIGIPLAASLAGDEAVGVVSLLSVIFIPFINVMSVVVLSVYGEGKERASVRSILLDVAKNPLIISVLLGVFALCVRAVLTSCGIEARLSDIKPVYETVEYLADMASPLALLVLGSRFEFSALSRLGRDIVLGTVLRTVIAPAIGIGVAYAFFRDSFTAAHFATFICAFATPVAVASVVMAEEMGGDYHLAGQLVVWTCATSAFMLFIITFLLRASGVFS